MSTSLSKLVDNLSGKNIETETANLSVALKGLKMTRFLIIAKTVKRKVKTNK